MPVFEIDVLITSTVTYIVEATNELEARNRWSQGWETSEFVESEEIVDVRNRDDRFIDDDDIDNYLFAVEETDE